MFCFLSVCSPMQHCEPNRLLQQYFSFALVFTIDGSYSRDLYTIVNCFEGVATRENNDSDSKRLFALISFDSGVIR